ncbi:hypothetical protein E2493_06255 [Sphingomonas parva]|uniref:Uncharacterized protein n=1 Tax=Sphingomonas parva TaxID=2555898 RepID=A0A4Y8ZT82_9SPHN|nr:hypothetical protein [Sphingomonas parva]TFI59124.1 hypothetical protein E2493_06255 [Sphingomonas parva]
MERGLERAYAAADDRSAVVRQVRRTWASQVARCSDDRCRETRLRDQLRRLRAGEQRYLVAIPAAGGRGGAVAGEMRVLPVEKNLILVDIWAMETRNGATCAVMASGRLRPDGTAEMGVVGAGQSAPTRFLLRRNGREAIRIAALRSEGGAQHACNAPLTFYGDYRKAPRRT